MKSSWTWRVAFVLAVLGIAGCGGAERKKRGDALPPAAAKPSAEVVEPAEPVPMADPFAEPVTLEAFPDWLRRYTRSLRWEVHEPHTRKLDRATLEASLALGRRFLVHNQKPEGNFNYQYNFVTGRMTPGDNQVRQAGALWGLALLYQDRPDAELKAALDRGLEFFFRHSEEGPVEGACYIAYPQAVECDTGTVALVGLALIEYLRADKMGKAPLSEAQRRRLNDRLDGYLAFLKFMRLESKHFSESYSLIVDHRMPRSSPYFDGEAMLCLIRAAKYLDREELIPLIEESAMVMAKCYTIDAWRLDPDSKLTKGFFQWSCMAFWEYQDAGWNHAEMYGDYVLCLAWWMIHAHHTLDRVRNTGYAYEGIVHAWRLAKSRNREDALGDLGYTIDRGLYKLTTWQVGGPLASQNPFLAAHPTADPLALGGVMNHRAEAPLRIDVAQHQMHAVLLALRHVYAGR